MIAASVTLCEYLEPVIAYSISYTIPKRTFFFSLMRITMALTTRRVTNRVIFSLGNNLKIIC